MRKTFFEKCTSVHLFRIAWVIFLLLPAITALGANPSQDRTVSGVVTSAMDKEPLIGVSVLVKGTAIGGITDFDGKYSLNVKAGETLVFSYIGYVTQEIRIADQATLNVALKEDTETLDEVVVVGYGVQKKKLVTGAAVQVKGDNIQKLNTTNPLQAMQGQTPGVTITSTTGQPGKDMKVSIRGLGTVGNSQPLYLIDGVGGDISTLNPADIESIDILKDAASAAIYGAQAANGVVLITTKQGKEGKAQIAFDAYYGVQNAARKVDMLNAKEYMMIMDEQALNSGESAYDWGSYKSIYGADGNVYDTNWIDAMIKDNAKMESYTLGITGGSSASTYAMSLGYMTQEGIMGGSDVSNYDRYNFRINSEHKLFDNFLKVGEHVSFIHKNYKNMKDEGNGYSGNRLYAAFNSSPLAPVYSDNGAYGSPYNNTASSDWNGGDGNPYGQMMTLSQSQNKNNTFSGDVYAEIEPIKNLKVKTLFAVVYSSSNYRSFTPKYQFDSYTNMDHTSVSQSAGDGFTMTWQNTAAYNWNLGDHALNALIGMEASRSDGLDVGAGQAYLTTGFDTWDKAYINNGTAQSKDTGLSASGSPWDSSRNVSYFGRLGWNWKETYMLNATLRCDGSSKFASGHRFGWFPSVSAGWTLTNEKWMQNTQSWMDYLKLRVSWGQVGNNNIDNYQYLAPVSYSGYYTFGNVAGSTSPGYVQGAYPSRLANASIKWETSEQTNIGLDARFLNGRLNMNADFYIKKTKDWLVQAPVLSTAGTNGPFINGGDVKNTGVELSFGWNDQIGNDFHYNIGVNGAYNKNEVGNIPTEDGIIHGKTGILYDNAEEFYRAQNGHSIGYFWGYKTAGIFQNQQEISDWIAAGNGVLQSNPQPGDVKYVDVDHNGAIDTKDKMDLGSGIPDFTYGFSLGFDYKGFDFSLNANGVVGNQIVQSFRQISNKQANYTTAILGRWTGEGTSNKLPRVTNTTDNWMFSDLYIQDGDFLRISNITLGYDFSKLLKVKYVSQARLYVQVQNAFTFTKYDGMDPEVGYGTEGWVSGVDQGFYPRPRTFLIGCNLKF